MRCPSCHNEETKVVDSRTTEEGSIIRRRRECEKCEFRFSTYEQLEILNLDVIKKSNERQPYEREKLEDGIRKACMKRPVTRGQIRNFVAEVEEEIMKRQSPSKYKEDTMEITTEELGEIVIRNLKTLDKIAYIRFASVYRSFDDIAEFTKEIKDLKENKK